MPLDDHSATLVEPYKKLGCATRLIVEPGQRHNMWRGFSQCQALAAHTISEASGI